MNEDLILLIVFAGFIILQRWILPKFGIHTCMSPNGCYSGKRKNKEQAAEQVIKVKKIDLDSIDS